MHVLAHVIAIRYTCLPNPRLFGQPIVLAFNLITKSERLKLTGWDRFMYDSLEMTYCSRLLLVLFQLATSFHVRSSIDIDSLAFWEGKFVIM